MRMTLIIRSVPMLPDPMIAQGIFAIYACSFANAARTEPRPEMRASYTSPLLTVTIGPSAPDITVSPAFKRPSDLRHGLGEPQRRRQRIAETGRPGADRDFVAAHLHHHAAQAQLEAVELLRARAEHVEAGGGVVGDRVENADLPVGDARIDDLDRRQGEFDRAQNVGDGQALVVEVAPDDEGDLGLDLGLDQLVGGHVPPVRNRHVVEQHAVVGLADAELALHGERGEADLAPDQSRARPKASAWC